MTKTLLSTVAAAAFLALAVPAAAQTDAQEMPITQLLNRLSAMGFAQYRSINKVGDTYVVEALTTDLQAVTLQVDTRTGEISQIGGPAAPAQNPPAQNGQTMIMGQ